jgi:phosphopentomutase
MTNDRRAFERITLIVLDSLGMGEMPDAAAWGDAGADTLGHVCESRQLKLPNLRGWGLGNIRRLAGVPPAAEPRGSFGRCALRSNGKDTTTGHWEMAGIILERAFPVYPEGFPAEVIERFVRETGVPGVLGNYPASGTEIIKELGEEHVRTGKPIVYTSADSVFQVAAHEDTVPLEALYDSCRVARAMLVAPHDVSRVIARPFAGAPGSYCRTANRRDFSIAPPGETLLDALEEAGVARRGVGKVDDLFGGRAVVSRHTAGNAEGIAAIRRWLEAGESGFLFANLIDFDQLYGHRNDVAGFYGALRELDDALPGFTAPLREDDLLFITADHGNDPTTTSTDHARECLPLLAFGARVRPRDVGRRSTFADLGATVAEWFGIGFRGTGTSFLAELLAA